MTEKEVLIVNKTTGEQSMGHQVQKTPAAHPTPESGPELPPASSACGEAPAHKPKKPKISLTSLYSLIEYGYSRKGQRISVRASDLKSILGNTTLTEADLLKLRQLAVQDRSFAVPRQLLLLARELREFPKLRNELREYVKGLLESHPVVVVNELQQWVRNQDGALSVVAAFRAVTATQAPALREKLAGESDLKAGELAVLKRNIVGCLAVWAAETRALSIAELMSALLDGYWEPTSSRNPSESELLRVLTEAGDPVVATAISQEFSRRASEHMRLAERSSQAAATTKTELTRVSADLDGAKAKVEVLEAELQGARETLRTERDKTRVDASHLRDDFETMRTRVLRSLNDDLKLLGDGVVALGRNPPKVEVMLDHAERVLDSLRREIKKLEEG